MNVRELGCLSSENAVQTKGETLSQSSVRGLYHIERIILSRLSSLCSKPLQQKQHQRFCDLAGFYSGPADYCAGMGRHEGPALDSDLDLGFLDGLSELSEQMLLAQDPGEPGELRSSAASWGTQQHAEAGKPSKGQRYRQNKKVS